MTEPKDQPAPDAPEDEQPEPANDPVEEPPLSEDDPSQTTTEDPQP